MFKNNRNLKTFGFILVCLSLVLFFMFYSTLKSVNLKVETNNPDNLVTVVYDDIKSSTSNSTTTYTITVSKIGDKEVTSATDSFVVYVMTTDKDDDFKVDLFKVNVHTGDEIRLYYMLKQTSNGANQYVTIGVEDDNAVYLDYHVQGDAYLANIAKQKTRNIYVLIGAIASALIGAAFLIIRYFNMKKEKEKAKNAITEYISDPTNKCPNTLLKQDLIYRNTKIAVYDESVFDPKDNPDITVIDYFKMVYFFTDLELPTDENIRPISEVDSEELANMINECYGKQKTRFNEINGLKNRGIYDKELWLGYYVEDKLVGVIIGDNDTRNKESSIEQLAVLPEYRNQGYATKLVLNYLHNVKNKTSISTVFARCDTATDPRGIFKRCGYDKEYHWYVINALDKEKVKKIEK